MIRITGIKAISFDVDGTLWDFDSIMRRALGEVLKELESADPEAAGMLDVARMIAIRERVHEELLYKVIELNEIRHESMRQALRDIRRPDDELAEHLFGVYVKHRDAGQSLFDDVLPAFQSLDGSYKLGLLSNGNSYADRLGLQGFVSFQVFSQDHGGIEKPDPRLFRIALQESGCRPDELLHVGDSLEYDVAGAVNAGVQAVWLNRNGGQSDAPNGTTEISSLRQLPQLL